MAESRERQRDIKAAPRPTDAAERTSRLGALGWLSNARAALVVNPWEAVAYAAIVLAALATRLWDLGSRAIHHDESLHAFYAWNLASGQGYEHNPMMHGPFQIEASAAVFRLFGDSDFTARILYVVAGTILVLMPLLLRKRLGMWGALFASAMLAVSPTMLYFSRFARNDIIMAVWTLGLVVCMWRYLDEGRNRYLYVAAAFLALAFATKETAYLVTGILGLYLVLVILSRAWPGIREKITVGRVSPPVALYRIASGVISSSTAIVSQSRGSRHAGFLMLLITVTLPMWAAMLSILQDTPVLSWSNLVLAAPVGGGGPIGAPLRGGNVLAAYLLIVLGLFGAYLGWRWRWGVWWRSAAIFYAIVVLLYTTLLSHPNGLGSGVWQSLGYWVVQQGEARGSQPWYYYFVIGPVYEYLPMLLAAAGAVYYLRRRDAFGHFLVFWVVLSLGLYTVASEKMPWLLLNITLPLVILAGRFLGELVGRIEWRRTLKHGGLALVPGVPLLIVLLYVAAFYDVQDWGISDVLLIAGALVGVAGLAVTGYLIARRIGTANFAAFATLPLVGILLILTVRTGWNAAYRNGDVPVEMIVYTQTTPDIARLVNETGDGVPVTIDGTNGFHWPWRWYLRNNDQAGFTSYEGTTFDRPPGASVLLVHSKNQADADPVLLEQYVEGKRIKHRWWFPENYRGLTPGKFLSALLDREAWRNAKDYFLHRKIRSSLGSEDAYVYFARGFPTTFEPSP